MLSACSPIFNVGGQQLALLGLAQLINAVMPPLVEFALKRNKGQRATSYQLFILDC